MVIEIDTFGDFATRDAKEDCTAAIVARCPESLEREGRLLCIGRFDENEFVFPDLVEDVHALPHGDD